jgi:uncharacterized protein with PIN domain
MPVNVTFRFYEELKGFLPKNKRKQPFTLILDTNCPVKHAIENLGIPHTEVDMILVNSKPVDFEYRLQDKDYVSVYPVFETFDISDTTNLRMEALREPKFILDTHLGKLAKYLRFLGFDTLYGNDFKDSYIISTATNEKRIILTRDKGILKNRIVSHGYYIRSQQPAKQVEEVIKRFNLETLINPFIRCSECNAEIKKVSKTSVADRLKARTKKYYNDFYRCTGCDKIYWRGSHFRELNIFIKKYSNNTPTD